MKRVAVLAFAAYVLWSVTLGFVPQTLTWTNPTFNAAVDDSGWAYCEESADSLHDLHHVELWGQPAYGGPARHITDVNVWGHEGQTDTVVVDREYAWVSWHYWMFTVDMSGNRSPCPSNVAFSQGNAVTGVDSVGVPIPASRWFDVQGRRVSGPGRNGVWFEQSGPQVWKVTQYQGRRLARTRVK